MAGRAEQGILKPYMKLIIYPEFVHLRFQIVKSKDYGHYR